MNIQGLHENWTALGQEDAMWVVLTDPDKKGGKWRAEDFFATGRKEMAEVVEQICAAGIALNFGRALDFGCGLGRLSQALGEMFLQVDGVDISASMIEQAHALNRLPAKVVYHLNVREDLRPFASQSYDLIYSNICLQHMPAKFQKAYVGEFVRLLKPGGIACFQMIHARGWRQCVPDFAVDMFRKWKHGGRPFIPMQGVPERDVKKTITNAGGVIHQKISQACTGHASRYVSDLYFVGRSAKA